MLRKRRRNSNQKNVENIGRPLVLLCPIQIVEVDIFEVRFGRNESIARRAIGIDTHLMHSAKKMSGDNRKGLLEGFAFRVSAYYFFPDPAFECSDGLGRNALE